MVQLARVVLPGLPIPPPSEGRGQFSGDRYYVPRTRVYLQTGDTVYRDRGDKAFAGGVRGAWLGGGKPFSQNYRWSFDYVTWRTQAEHRRVGSGQAPTQKDSTGAAP